MFPPNYSSLYTVLSAAVEPGAESPTGPLVGRHVIPGDASKVVYKYVKVPSNLSPEQMNAFIDRHAEEASKMARERIKELAMKQQNTVREYLKTQRAKSLSEVAAEVDNVVYHADDHDMEELATRYSLAQMKAQAQTEAKARAQAEALISETNAKKKSGFLASLTKELQFTTTAFTTVMICALAVGLGIGATIRGFYAKKEEIEQVEKRYSLFTLDE